MNTPLFWYQPQGFFSTLLRPLGWLYGKGCRILLTIKRPQRFHVPVISIGSVVCGGAGKTPTAIALAQLLQEKGHKVHFVTRGYGGQLKGPLAVDLSRHQPQDVGDEPLLLAQYAPTWVAKKRYQGAQKAIAEGAQLIILDDGHQTTSLYKDISFVVIDLLQGFGNERVIPAGPLREELSAGIKRANGFISIGRGKSSPLQPCFRAQIFPEPLTTPSNRAIAFCGLGFPQKFYLSLVDAGFELVATETFPDHYQYTDKDLLKLRKLAQAHHGILVTTRKDLIKIPPSWQDKIHVLDISIQFEDPKGIYDFILQKIHLLKEVA